MRTPLVTALWRLGLILFGFAVATLVAALSHVPEAGAEELPPAERRAQPAAADPETAYEAPRRISRSASDSLYDLEADPADDAWPGEDSFSETDGSASPSGEGTEDGAPAGLDGTIDLAEPEPPEDGADPTRDTRPPEDRDTFMTPPAGYDPLLFQVEDIDPATTDRRPARLARFEPYDPVGIRIGSFVLFPEVELGGIWTDNVLFSPDRHSDIALGIGTAARLVSNWSRHALEVRGTTRDTFQDAYPSEDDRAWSIEARGRLDVTRRTNLQAIVGRDFGQEDRSAIDASRIGQRADVTVERAEAALSHRFNRLSVQLRGSVSDVTYSDTDGMSNADRDTLETRQAVRAAWEFKPTLSVFAEQEWNERDKGAIPADGIPRDSDGTRTRIGLDFGSTGAVLRGTIGIGYGRQVPDAPSLAPVDAVLFDANLAWRPTEITSLLLTAASDIYDTTTVDSGGVITHTAGLELRHAFRRYLIASAGIAYTRYDYDATPITESQWLSFAGLEYYASPDLVLFTRYEHLAFDSNDADGDYDRDELRFGVRVRR